MTYDSTPSSGLAQRYFVQALALAKAADDKPLGGDILDAMSHQATYMGRYTEAANLARAAKSDASSNRHPHAYRTLSHYGSPRTRAPKAREGGVTARSPKQCAEFERRPTLMTIRNGFTTSTMSS